MAKVKILSAVMLLLSIGAYSQDLNLDYEDKTNNKPSVWIMNRLNQSGFSYELDSLYYKSGKYSLRMLSDRGDKVVTCYHKIPNKFKGRNITLSGYIKTANLEGYAGLWMEMLPNNLLENMYDKGPIGTSDWKSYSITIPLVGDTIIFGTMLYGKGTSWFDGLTLTIDNEPIDLKNKEIYYDIKIDPTIENFHILEKICHIWGILKYFHPQIRKGHFDMDLELLNILEKTINNKKSIDYQLSKWIKHFGKKGGYISSCIDDEWIKNNCSPSLITQLKRNVCSYDSTSVSYVTINNNGIVSFIERPYSERFPNTFYRILALFRYWNIVKYYYPYLDNSERWNQVLSKYIPLFIAANTEKEYKEAILKLVAEIQDSHAVVANTSKILHYGGSRVLLPKFIFVGDTLVVHNNRGISSDKSDELLAGDIILTINHVSVESIRKTLSPYISSSNSSSKLSRIANIISTTDSNQVHLTYIRDGKEHKVSLSTYNIDSLFKQISYNKPDTCLKIFNDSIAYLNTANVKKRYFDAIWSRIQKTKGLIIDLRCYPQYFLINELGSKLINSPTPFYRAGIIYPFNPGKIHRFIPSSAILNGSTQTCYNGKIAILVNNETGSRGEFAAMAFSLSSKAVVIGSETMGADGDIVPIWLPGGIKTYFSGMEITYPDGRQTQRKGIIPDIYVKNTINDIKNKRDAVLDAAIGILSNP